MDRPRRGHRDHGRGDARGEPPRSELIAGILDWLASLPPEGIYGAIALLAAFENIVPPIPADTAVALGAFLAARDAPITPLGVYIATLSANLASAVGVFLLAGRYGRGFLDSPTGRRLLAPESRAAIERAWRRHHLWGLFVGRFLPGYRAVVPPMAAMMGIPAWRALPPIVLASAIWYGIVIWIATRIGENWDLVARRLGNIGAVALIVAVLVTAVLVQLWRRHRARLRAGSGGAAPPPDA